MARGTKKSHPQFARGGSHHMLGKTGASPQRSGTTSGASHGSTGGKAHGGSGHMVGKQKSTACKPL